MRTAGTKILSLALAVLLALGTLPQTVLAVGATPPEGAGGKIIAFEALSDSVANQTKPIGTALVELNLPVTLLVTVEVENPEELVRDSGEPAQEDIADDTNTDTPDGESDNGGSVSGNNASDPARDEENEGIPDEEESLPGTPSDAQQSNGNSDLLRIQSTTGSALALGNSGTQQTVSVAVLEWGSEPEYDPQTTGTYVFTPVLDEAWSLAEDVERPTITVEVEASSVSPVFRSMLASSGSTGVNLGISPALAGRASNPTDPNSSPQVSSPTLSESTTVWYGGYEWVVIGWDGEGVAPEVGMATLLFANANTTKPSSSQFHDSSNQYADSTLQAAMNDFYNNLPEKEQGAIATRSLSGNSGNFSYNTYGSGDIDVSSFNSAANDAGKVADKYIQRYRLAANNTFDWYAYDNMRKNGTVSSGESTAYTGTYDPDNVAGDDEDLTAEKFWPLSVAEASLLDESIRTYSANWWLRSPGNVDYYAAVVSNSGDVHADGGDVASTRAVRPAFHLNLASVLFASDVSGASAKSAATVGSGLIGASAPGTSLKFTMLDTSNLSLSASDSAITKAAGETVEIEYTGAVTGTDKYVSAVLTDGDDKVLYYGKLSQAASGTASFTVPGGLTAGSYTLKLFNEECNGDNKTDFASAPVEIPLTVEENGGGGISGAYSWMTVNQTQSNTTKVWYGADTHGNSDSTTWDPYQWYVIGLDGEGVASESGTITLFSIDGMGNDSFNSTNDAGNEYINSRLRKLLTEGSEGWRLTNIPERERALMISRELVGGSGNQGTEEYEDDRIAGADVSDAKLWPLSVNEANQLDNSVRQLGYDWWLRSPGYNDLRAAVVNDLGSVFAYGNNVHDSNAVRPAFKLNLSSVLFASDAEGGKSSATVGSNLIGASAPGTNVKFTVLDDAQTLSVLATMAQATQSGDSLQFTYANASIGTNQYVSCVLEQDGEVNYYGKLANSSGEASGTLSIPLTGVANGTYTLKIFSEQANEDYYTDFASTPITMTVNVTNNSGTVSDFDGTIDSTAPTISTITPANGATAVEPSGNIEITFSEAMNTAANVGTVSLNNGTITLTGGTWSTTTANTYIIGYSSLAYDTAYTITVTGFQDTAGNVMTVDSSHSFTTMHEPDTTSPTVENILPANGAADVERSGNIVITFNEPMKTTAGTVSLNGIGALTGGTWSTTTAANDTYTVAYSGLDYSTQYTITVTGFQDTAGNVMTVDSSHSFTTMNEPDTTPPTVESILPANGAADVERSGNIVITFNEPMKTTVGTVRLNGIGALTGGAWSTTTAANDTYTVAYSGLDYSTEYTITVTGFQDTAGNVMTVDSSHSFTTMNEPDTTRPTVESILPANGATAVERSGNIVITFNEPMKTTAGTVSLNGIGALTGGTWSTTTAANDTYTVAYSGLDYSTQYTITVTGFQDTAGNVMTVDSSHSFTTMNEPDTTPPTVESILPANGAADVERSGNIVITFNEPMKTTVGTVRLNGMEALTGGTWSNSNKTYTVSFSSLAYDITYTITVTDFQDTAGNVMTDDTSHSFTTMHEPDTTRPTVESILPANGAADVERSGNIAITFDEPMKTTVGTVSLNGMEALTGGTWSNSNKTYTVSFSSLAYDTAYTITIEDFADAAGNVMTDDTSHSFTTMHEPDTTRPTVESITPANGATDVERSGNIAITFDEPMKTTVGTVSLNGMEALTGGTWSNSNKTYTVSFSSLAYDTTYTITVTGFQDEAGNVMTDDSSHSFTTMHEPDTTPPTVESILPANGATDVERSGNIVITFNEPMKTTVGTVLLNGREALTGTWSNSNKTYAVSFSSLAYDTAYTITVTGFQDTAGNVMTDDSSHSFTTKAQPAGPDVSATILNLDLNGSATSTLTISLGQSGNQAAQASISVNTQNQDDISISPAALTDDGTVTVTGLRTVSGAGITVTFSGGDLASTTTVSVAVNVTDSTPPPATAHTVTVQNDGRGTGSASPSSATQGETVTLTATPASGSYYFSHWEVVSGGAIPSGNSFVMPDNDVTVKAHFGRYSSGGNDSGNDNTAPTVTIPPAAQPDWPTIGSASGKVAGTNTQRTFTITDSLVKSALEKAQAEAKAQNRTAYGIGAQLMLDTPATAGLTLTLERAALNRLVSAGAKQFEIEGAPISLTLDAKALAELQKQSTGNVTITIKPVTVEGVRNAYDISFSYVKNGKAVNITSLGTGTATLSIPCTPAKGEAAGGFYAVYVDGKGKLNRIADSSYDANSGSMIFSTNHFSVYGVGYTAPSAKLTDIKKHWAKESIDYVVGRGLLSGTSETTFAPDTAMTRGMLVTALGRLAGVDVNAYTTNSFTDVKADSTFRPYIEWAYKKGIVQGIGNSKFAPDRAVTREEIAVIFSNYAKATGYTLPVTRTTTTYADASSIGSIYKTAVTAMQQAGIMMGGTGGKFNPKASATRAEVSSMLHRYIKLTIDPATAQGWTKNDAGQYFYYKDGKALTGTQTISGVKYFFETTGILKTGWIKDNNGNWRFYSGNTMLVGFWDLGANGNNKTYYFDTYGNMVTGKWLQIDGKWYYFNADGSLARSTKIDGYEVDENGVRKTK